MPLSGVGAFRVLKGKFEFYQDHRSRCSHISRDQLALTVIHVSKVLSTGRAFLIFRGKIGSANVGIAGCNAAS